MKNTIMEELFENTVKMYPHNIAILEENKKITYEELYQLSVQAGFSITCKLNGKKHCPILIYMEKSLECIVSMLGCLYSGNIYVPLDVKTPLERMNLIKETVNSDYVITTTKEGEKLQEINFEGNIMYYEDLIKKKIDFSINTINNTVSELIDTDLMYILFTSGSTGIPKGVAVMFRSVIDYMDSLSEIIEMTSNDVFGNQTPFYADMSLKDIYLTIRSGGTICIIPQRLFMSPKKLVEYLDENKVTLLAWVPTAYRIVSQFNALSVLQPRFLRKFIFSGENMPIQVFKYWRKFYPDADYIQLYGPTEITGACMYFKVDKEYEKVIPIGKPFRNTGILLMSEDKEIINPDNVEKTGEICVYGSCLAAGYYNNKEKTKEVFVQNPLHPQYDSVMYLTGDLAKWNSDGNLVFVSRKDYQVKHGGRRIELGEIENAALAIKEIDACCCVQQREKDILVLFYVGDIESREIIRKMNLKLPKYMIPAEFRKIKELPLLSNGKLDRKLMDQLVNNNRGE